MAFNTREDERKAQLEALKAKISNTIQEKDKRLEDFFEEKKVTTEYDIKHKDTRFNVLPDHMLWCMDALDFTLGAPPELALQSLMATINFATSSLYLFSSERIKLLISLSPSKSIISILNFCI